MKNSLIVMVFSALLWNIEGQLFTCDPVVDCANGVAMDLVPHPDDCTKYYICTQIPPDWHVGPSTVSQCPPGMYFDQVRATCLDEAWLEPCHNVCPPKKWCQTKCPQAFDDVTLVGSKIDCSYFKVCGNESETLLQCAAENPYFTGDECVKLKIQCCDFCIPYCPQIDLPIQDPCNCNNFYSCSEYGPITSGTTSIPCDSGEYFDEDSGQCKIGTCTSSCPSCTVTTEFTTEPPRSDPAFNKKQKSG